MGASMDREQILATLRYLRKKMAVDCEEAKAVLDELIEAFEEETESEVVRLLGLRS